MRTFELIGVLHEGVVRIVSNTMGVTYTQLWTTCELRKPRACSDCGTDMVKKQKVFWPITHANNRSLRLCVPCVDKLKERFEAKS